MPVLKHVHIPLSMMIGGSGLVAVTVNGFPSPCSTPPTSDDGPATGLPAAAWDFLQRESSNHCSYIYIFIKSLLGEYVKYNYSDEFQREEAEMFKAAGTARSGSAMPSFHQPGVSGCERLAGCRPAARYRRRGLHKLSGHSLQGGEDQSRRDREETSRRQGRQENATH
jgi:hypothetical protein